MTVFEVLVIIFLTKLKSRRH